MTNRPSPPGIKPSQAPRDRERGLTLTELLVAAALTAVAIGGAVTMANLTGDTQRAQIASTQDRAAIARVGEVLLKKADGMTFIGVTPDSTSTAATLAYVDTGRSMRGKITQSGSNYVITVPRNTLTTSEEGRSELIAAVNRTGQVSMMRLVATGAGGTRLTMRPPAGVNTCAPDLNGVSTLYPMATVSLALMSQTSTINEARDLPETDAERRVSVSDVARGSADMKLTYVYAGPNSNALLSQPAGSRYTSGGMTLSLSGINVMVRTKGTEATEAISSHIPLEATGQISLDANGNCEAISSNKPPEPGDTPTPDRGITVIERGLPTGTLLANITYQGNTQPTSTNLKFRDTAALSVPDDASSINLSAYPVRYTTADGATLVYVPSLNTSTGNTASGTATMPATINNIPTTARVGVTLTYTVIKANVTFDYPQDWDTMLNSKMNGWNFSSVTGPVNDPNYQSDMQKLSGPTVTRTDLIPGTYQLLMPQIKISDGTIATYTPDPYNVKNGTRPVYAGASYLTPYAVDVTLTQGGTSTLVYTGTPANLHKLVFSSAENGSEPRYKISYRYRRVVTNGRTAGETCLYGLETNPNLTTLMPPQQNPTNRWQTEYQTQWFWNASYIGDPWISPQAPSRPTGQYYSGSGGNDPVSARGIYDACIQINMNHIAADRQTLQIPQNGAVVGGPNVTDTIAQANAFLGGPLLKNYANYMALTMPGTDATRLFICASSETNLAADKFSWVTTPVSSCNSGTPSRVLFEVTIARRAMEASQTSPYRIDTVGISNSVYYSNFYGNFDAPLMSNESPDLYYRNVYMENYGFTKKTGYSWTNSSAAWHWNIVRDNNKFVYGTSQRKGYSWRTCNGTWPTCGADGGWNDRWADPGDNIPTYKETDTEILGTRFYADDNWGGCTFNGNPCTLNSDGYTPNFAYTTKEFYMKPGTRLFSVTGFHKMYGYWEERSAGYWGKFRPGVTTPTSFLAATYPVNNIYLGP